MHKKPFNDVSFMITNDDGIMSSNLFLLAQAALQLSDDVTIVAPVSNKSGTGTSLTMHKVLFWQHKNPLCTTWVVKGTPADCVVVGLRGQAIFPDKKPQVVLSGVNFGDNAGRTLLYSGTVGAAIVAALEGAVGIAFSQRIGATIDAEENCREDVVSTYISRILHMVLPHELSRSHDQREYILNVNIPCYIPKGILLTEHCHSVHYPQWDDSFSRHGIMTSEPTFPKDSKSHRTFDVTKNKDAHLLDSGYVTVTPILVSDFNDHEAVKTNPWGLDTL